MTDPFQTPPRSSPQRDEPARPLNYLSPRNDPGRDAAESARAFFGGILTFLLLLILIVVWIVSRMSRMVVGRPTVPGAYPPPSNLWPVIATVSTIALLGGIAVFQYRRHNSTAFTKGILIGIGFTACVAGLCAMGKSC